MRKSTRIVKRTLALFLVVLMSINTLGAVVSDNDGAAFITKAEFDSLKNDFQSQIDQYNTSIDSKIDGAIVGYLAGMSVSKQVPLDNDLKTIKINDTQYVKDLLWSKSTDFRINEPKESAGDTQLIGQFVRWYATAPQNDIATQMSLEYLNGYKENRLEVDRDNGIIAWGQYAVSVDGVVFYFNDIGSDVYDGSAVGFFPYPATTIGPVMRKPAALTWNCFTHYGSIQARWESHATTKATRPEGSWIKYNEVKPSDALIFDMDLFRISPLSEANDAVLSPPPKMSDADYSYNNSDYGNYCGSDGQVNLNDVVSADPTIATLSYTKMTGAGDTTTYKTTTAARIHKNLCAKWFKVLKTNCMHLGVVTSALNVKSLIKCGLPITRKVEFYENDKIICKITNVPETGYLVLYVAKDPMENWNGAKPSYVSDKWKLERNVQKTIEIEVTQKIKGHVFAVWLPDIDCKIPDINMVIER